MAQSNARIVALLLLYARRPRSAGRLDAVPHAPRARWRRVAAHRRPLQRRDHCRAHERWCITEPRVRLPDQIETTSAEAMMGTQPDVAADGRRRPQLNACVGSTPCGRGSLSWPWPCPGGFVEELGRCAPDLWRCSSGHARSPGRLARAVAPCHGYGRARLPARRSRPPQTAIASVRA